MRFPVTLSLLFILLIPCGAAQDSMSVQGIEPHPYAGCWIMVNPGSKVNPEMWNFSGTFSGQEIYNTARARSLYMAEDQEPVIDDHAIFMSPPESRVEIRGLKPKQDLVMYIDFIRYYGKKQDFPAARLDIIIESGFSSEKVTSIIPSDIPVKGPVVVILPAHATFSGSFRLIFREFSSEKGFWGFWDFIIADRKIDITKLPLNKSEIPAKIPDNMKIVE